MESAIVDVGKLVTELETKCAEMAVATKQLTDARKEGDEQKIGDASKNLDLLNDELKALDEKVDMARAAKRRSDLLAEARELAKPAAKTAAVHVDVPAAPVPAQAKDHDVEERAKRSAFFAYMGGNDPVGEKRKLLEPRSKKLQDCGKQESPVVVIPRSLIAAMCGPRIANVLGAPSGKAMLATADAVNNPSFTNFLFNNQYIPQVQQLPFPEPVWLPRVSIVPTTSGTATVWPSLAQTDSANANGDFGGVSWSWISEGAEKPETEPEFDQITVTAFEVAGYTEVSQRALKRSEIALEAYLRMLFGASFEYFMDSVILNGTGVGQPSGIIPFAGVRNVARAAAGAVGWADFVNLKHAVLSHHRNGARYAMHDNVEQATTNLLDADGRPIFTTSVTSGPVDRVLGFPYDVSYNCQSIGTTGDVVYGNPAWYTLTIEEEFGIARSEHFRFRNDLIAYRMYAVVGGRPMLPRAFSILADAES